MCDTSGTGSATNRAFEGSGTLNPTTRTSPATTGTTDNNTKGHHRN